ncbi:Enkurin [Gryllus bimaculatus]|nr:Enkurin [Gryllus bimaculatus]
MSLVTITHHNENIHNILDPPKSSIQAVQAITTRCMYISKYRPKIVKEEKKNKECHKTLGYAQVPLPKPCEFLRKNTRIVPPRPVTAGPKCCLTCRRPCLPSCPVVKKEPSSDKTKAWEEGWKKGQGKRYPCPSTNEKETEEAKKQASAAKVCAKNFALENIRKVVHSVPRQPVPKYVDSHRGHSQSLLRSGLLPIYIHKKTYGKVPGYIVCRKSSVGSMGAPPVCQAPVPATPGVYVIPEEERQALLEGLRKNWNELQTAYQHMPILIDTMHKRARKERMEKELRRLELNISTLERHNQIYVVDDALCA